MVQETHSRPSELVGLDDKLDAFVFDSTVVTFGTIFENALAERVNVAPPGSGKYDYQSKYTITQLMKKDFFLPDPSRPNLPNNNASFGFNSGLDAVLALAGQQHSNVKRWVYTGMEPEQKT